MVTWCTNLATPLALGLWSASACFPTSVMIWKNLKVWKPRATQKWSFLHSEHLYMIFWYSSYKVYHSILLRMKIDHPQRYWKFLLQIYLIFKNHPTNPCGSVIIADSLPSWECVQPADRTTSCGGRTVEFILVPLQCWNLLISPEFL